MWQWHGHAHATATLPIRANRIAVRMWNTLHIALFRCPVPLAILVSRFNAIVTANLAQGAYKKWRSTRSAYH
ncbi:MAG TPA: hypothetical protein VFU49_10000 [Ktedonobacteraceae bacterium]|nr:hypothetical protein [Ktedonobacteraceae bacterium]